VNMTRAQGWLIALVTVTVLAVAVLLAGAAGSFAQEGSPNPTESPAATEAPTDGDGSEDGAREGCPDKQQDSATEETQA
jgi:hypothetical protein